MAVPHKGTYRMVVGFQAVNRKLSWPRWPYRISRSWAKNWGGPLPSHTRHVTALLAVPAECRSARAFHLDNHGRFTNTRTGATGDSERGQLLLRDDVGSAVRADRHHLLGLDGRYCHWGATEEQLLQRTRCTLPPRRVLMRENIFGNNKLE